MRWRRLLVIGICTAGLMVFLMMVTHPQGFNPQLRTPGSMSQDLSAQSNLGALPIDPATNPESDSGLDITPRPRLIKDQTQHPVHQLMSRAEEEFTELRARQSKTLAEAVQEYKRRYGMNPPPLFDQWYQFAMDRGVQLVDEYDTIYRSLLPFWALPPATNRKRVAESLGREGNGLIAMLIRGGEVVTLKSGPEWQRNVTYKMMSSFIHLLPDMDIAFNIHDEPRVVVPHDELSHMVRTAKAVTAASLRGNPQPRNRFSRPPKDLGDGMTLSQVYLLRFNEFAHQPVWADSRLSCPPDSAARDYQEQKVDRTDRYAFSELGFVYNQTALSDICNTPSLRDSHGFFDRPNAFKVTHELIPIFSQSKVSCFNDILYPSPWYYYGKTVTDQPADMHKPQYDGSLDMDWKSKESKFWWRGTTTGGYSRNGGWRHQHRQQFVTKILGLEPTMPKAKILANKAWVGVPNWGVTWASWQKYWDFLNITFTGVGQCDEPDCVAQRNFFPIDPPVNGQQAWRYRYLLDMDGNAFSGRFYAFLRSNSQVFKLAIFREWHDEWLKPWVHFVPLSLRGDEYLESVRYFAEEAQGQEEGPRMAQQGREWANKALRNEDMEVWMFRLLLEYARVLDDARETIGYSCP